ncbi:MAG: choice-of-anchor P family protein, partial [Acidimicrobiales bacterium]
MFHTPPSELEFLVAKVTTRVAGVASALVLVLGLFLVVSPGSSGAAPGDASGSAFGISASGVVDIAPTPTSPPDATEVFASVPGVVSAGVLTTTANLTGTAFTSTATVANVDLGAGTVTADAVSSTCTADG